MRTLIVYDSLHGNTAQIAQAIADALAGEVSVRRPDGADGAPEVKAVDLLIVGSPTHGGWFTEALKGWLDQLPATGLQGLRVAAFDTRTPPTILSRIFGFAAPRIASRLEKKGGTLLALPEGFLVQGIKGPLKEGELERATAWAKELVENRT
ncbi:MAG: flavodoxin family protein [Chloroflexota bacterium]